jgi:hypothetical protein
VRAGGRCTFCNEYLLESDLTLRPVLLGEIAHNVAASDAGPRGDANISEVDRNLADNLLLLCGRHHPDTDKRANLDLLTVDQLQALKAEHERRVLEATASVGRSNTVLLRMQGNVRGAVVDVALSDATEAVIRSSDRFPELALSFDRRGVEIDLRQIAGELTAGSEYYSAASARIDELVLQRLQPAVEAGAVEHLSVFALARFPLLVHLGSRLDDTVRVDVFQRHRASEDWSWPSDVTEPVPFRSRRLGGTEVDSLITAAALIINASGTIHQSELPAEVSQLPLFVIEPEFGAPHPDSVATRSVRDSFESAVRRLLSQLEAELKQVRHIHVFAAAPVALGVTLGRSVGWGIHPTLVVYDRRDDGTYCVALEVRAP